MELLRVFVQPFLRSADEIIPGTHQTMRQIINLFPAVHRGRFHDSRAQIAQTIRSDIGTWTFEPMGQSLDTCVASLYSTRKLIKTGRTIAQEVQKNLTGDINLDADWLKTLGKHLSTQTLSVAADEREIRLASVAAYRAKQAEVRAEAERKCLELEDWIGKLQALPSGDA